MLQRVVGDIDPYGINSFNGFVGDDLRASRVFKVRIPVSERKYI